MSGRKTWALGLFLVAGHAGAAVEQVDGTAIPRPVGTAEQSLVTQSWGWNVASTSLLNRDGTQAAAPIVFGEYYSPPSYPQFVDGDAITLQGMFKWRKENIDVQADASAPAGTFVPKCPLVVEPVLVGGNCQATLGWYNVPDPTSSTPPSASDVFELVPNLGAWLSCKQVNGTPSNHGFCPLGWDNRYAVNLSLELWVRKQATVDLATDARYLGGAIGFALLGDPQRCSGAAYSVRTHNPRNENGLPYVTALVYPSKVELGAIYLAFEDGRMLPGGGTNVGMSDGDYNDYVAYVSGCFNGVGGGANGSAGGGAGGNTGPGGAGAGGASNGLAGASHSGGAGSLGGSVGDAGSNDASGASATASGGLTASAGSENPPPTQAGADAVGGSAGAGSNAPASEASSCGCRVNAPSGSGYRWFLAAVIGFTCARRGRRRRSAERV